MLNAPGHRATEAEGERGDQAAGPVPAAVAEPQHQPGATEPHHDKQRGIDGPQARRAGQRRERKIWGREDHRLRVGDLRVAAEGKGRPERRLPAMQCPGQEGDLGREYRLAIPWNGGRAAQPRPIDEHGQEEIEAKGQTEGVGAAQRRGRPVRDLPVVVQASPELHRRPPRALCCARGCGPAAARGDRRAMRREEAAVGKRR